MGPMLKINFFASQMLKLGMYRVLGIYSVYWVVVISKIFSRLLIVDKFITDLYNNIQI